MWTEIHGKKMTNWVCLNMLEMACMKIPSKKIMRERDRDGKENIYSVVQGAKMQENQRII